MRKIRIVIWLTTLAIVAAACGSAGSTPSSTTAAPGSSVSPEPGEPTEPFIVGELIRLDVPRLEPSVSSEELAAVVAGDSALGLAVFGEVADDENVMISPYSIATALSMLYPGARGATADEIAEVLNLTVTDEVFHSARNVIESALAAVPPTTPDDDREPFAIRPANSAWGQGGFPFSEDYLAVLAQNYGAGLRVVDYMNEPGIASDTINDWVAAATQDRIKDLIPDGVINTDTRLVLANAIWFKANWAEKFDPSQTAPGEFTLLDGSTVTVPLMHGGLRGSYTETDRFTAVRLPYAGDASMVVALPNEGMTPAELAATLTAADLRLSRSDFQIDLTLPSFEFESTVPLKQSLQAVGMVEAFTENADLTGITDAASLFVQDALHKSFIALDEDGTEAAAATALVVGLTSAPPPATFTADRPFLFWIEHGTTGEILFLGQVTNPS